ncbi:MAG TPA: glycosyltransferase family A protein [Acidimicrobiales bacterium]|nr:glycosyltransferase family A protein [Acidimicrobiales bacterium]
MRSHIAPRSLAPPPRPPRVSVVVPCYRYGHFLPACVESIVSQQGVAADVLIVDDASADDSGDVADALAAQHAEVSVIRHRQNMGHIRTYNEGLRAVDGDYIVLLSADDLLTPGCLARATTLMEARPDVGLVYGHPNEFDGSHPVEVKTRFLGWSVWTGREWIALRFRRGYNCIYSPEAVIRATVQHQIGGYRQDLPHSGDMEMWLRAAAVSNVGRVDGPDQALHRVHDTNMSRTQFSGVVTDLAGRLAAYDAFLRSYDTTAEHARLLRTAACRSLAAQALYHACDLQQAGRADDAVPLVEFARSIYDDVDRLPTWREFRWRDPNGPREAVLRKVLTTRRQYKERARWHRWRWSGV